LFPDMCLVSDDKYTGDVLITKNASGNKFEVRIVKQKSRVSLTMYYFKFYT